MTQTQNPPPRPPQSAPPAQQPAGAAAAAAGRPAAPAGRTGRARPPGQPPANRQPPTTRQQPGGRWADRGPGSFQREAALEDMRQKMHQFVIHELGPLLFDQRVGEADLRRQVDEQLHRALSQERLALTGAERQQLVQSVTDDVLGYGPIDQLLREDDITEVMVNGPDLVYVERKGRSRSRQCVSSTRCTSAASSTRS